MGTAANVSTPQNPKYLFLHQMQGKGLVMNFSVLDVNVVERHTTVLLWEIGFCSQQVFVPRVRTKLLNAAKLDTIQLQ